jgi:hypothetical protein
MKCDLRVFAFCALVAACSKGSSPSPPAPAATAAPAASPTLNSAAAAAPLVGAAQPVHRYEVKSGILVMTNSMLDGMQETLYFDDYGAKQATYSRTDMKMMGQTIHTEKVSIDADGYHVDYDPEKKTGSRHKLGAGIPSSGGAPAVDVKNLTEEMRKEMKIQELPPRTIDGKVANGYGMETMGFKVRAWTWKGLPLYSETDMGKKPIIVSAKSVKIDVTVPADKFVVPPDVKLTDF